MGNYVSIITTRCRESMKIFIFMMVLVLFCKALFAADLLCAIQRQESGGNPLALNIAGKSVMPKTREEAEALIERAWAAGVSFDVGLMQINCQWMRRFGVDPKSMLDPDRNLAWGRWILDQEIRRHGRNWKAVGRYHSPDHERGRQYAWQIYRKMTDGKAEQAARQARQMREDVRHGRGIIRPAGKQRPGRIISFDVRPARVSGDAGQKPGRSAGPAGAAED